MSKSIQGNLQHRLSIANDFHKLLKVSRPDVERFFNGIVFTSVDELIVSIKGMGDRGKFQISIEDIQAPSIVIAEKLLESFLSQIDNCHDFYHLLCKRTLSEHCPTLMYVSIDFSKREVTFNFTSVVERNMVIRYSDISQFITEVVSEIESHGETYLEAIRVRDLNTMNAVDISLQEALIATFREKYPDLYNVGIIPKVTMGGYLAKVVIPGMGADGEFLIDCPVRKSEGEVFSLANHILTSLMVYLNGNPGFYTMACWFTLKKRDMRTWDELEDLVIDLDSMTVSFSMADDKTFRTVFTIPTLSEIIPMTVQAIIDRDVKLRHPESANVNEITAFKEELHSPEIIKQLLTQAKGPCPLLETFRHYSESILPQIILKDRTLPVYTFKVTIDNKKQKYHAKFIKRVYGVSTLEPVVMSVEENAILDRLARDIVVEHLLLRFKLTIITDRSTTIYSPEVFFPKLVELVERTLLIEYSEIAEHIQETFIDITKSTVIVLFNNDTPPLFFPVNMNSPDIDVTSMELLTEIVKPFMCG